MTRRRGFSLALVLLVATIALGVGTAMAALSSMSLNLAMQGLSKARAHALACGVVAEIRYEMDRAVWRRETTGLSLRDVKARFRNAPIFPDPRQEVMAGDLRAWVDFEHTRYFSVDNLNGAGPVASSQDAGTARTTVPPYSLDLVVMTGVGDNPDTCADPRRFEAVVTRVWPFALYSVAAPVVIGGGSRVRGSAYGYRSPIIVGDAGDPVVMKGDVCSGLPRDRRPIQVKDGTLDGRLLYEVPPWGSATADPLALLRAPTLLMPLDGQSAEGFQPQYKALPVTQESHFARVGEFQQFLGGTYSGSVGRGLYDRTNELLDKVTVWHGSPPTHVKDLNPYRGHLNFRLPWDNRGEDGDIATNAYFADARVLVDDLALADDYYETSSISNHFAAMKRTVIGLVVIETLAEDLWTGNATRPATIHLDNCVLHVRGDLDIRDLSGDNSTLIVDGNLYLNGGSLDSGNKGMLILATNVFMEARGDFRGLIAARDNLWMKPLASGERLFLHGGVVVGGSARGVAVRDAVGTVLMPPSDDATCLVNSTTLVYDSKYTRALNRLGVSRLSLLREIP